MLNAKKAGGGNNSDKKFVQQEVLAPGVYPGRLVQVIDLGLQAQRPYMGKDKPPAHEVMFTYELVDCFMVDENGNEVEEKPRWLSETFPFHNLKAEKAKSTQRILALDPESAHEGDVSQMLETPVNVTVVNNPGKDGKVYENVAGLSPMRPRDAAKCPELKNPTKIFDLSDPDMEVFNKLPEWLREKIKGNLNFKGSALEKALGGEEVPKEEKKPAAKKAADKKEQEEEEAPWNEEDNPY